MRPWFFFAIVFVVKGFCCLSEVSAGVHYSKEQFADLPSQWRGFLPDQRFLRQLAIKLPKEQSRNELRKSYESDLARLEKLLEMRQSQPVDFADLGALYIRLGNYARAVEVLRLGDRVFPAQFRILSNLATAWFLSGEQEKAIAQMQQVVKLAPGAFLAAEQLVLDWMLETKAESWKSSEKYFQWAQKILAKNYLGEAQLVGLWLVADGRLLAQFAFLAAKTNQPDIAISITDGCVTEFGIRDTELLKLRGTLKQTSEKDLAETKKLHEEHKGQPVFRSLRPLKQESWNIGLPKVNVEGWNALPWFVLSQTQIGKKGVPAYPEYIRQLEGKKVTLEGFMQPVGEDSESNVFLLLENPVGCWYCEMPALNGMVYVEMANEKILRISREQIRIRGVLQLRGSDPEKFLFTIQAAIAE